MSITSTNIETEKALVPQLRFKEFDEEWAKKQLDEIASIERGRFSPRPRNNPIYYGGEIPFVQTSDVVNSKGKISLYSQTLNEKGLKVSKKFPKGSLLITIAANIGFAGVLEIDMACPDSLVGLKCKNGLYNWFLNYLLEIEQPRMDYLAVEAAQKNINIEFIRPYPFILPSLPEQQKIAAFLSAVDEKIQQLTRKKDLLTQYKKDIMQKLFSQEIRFKIENEDGELVEPPDWEEKRLGDLTYKVGKKNKANIQYPIYSINNQEGFLPQSEQFEGMDSNDRGYDISMYKIIHPKTFAYNPARINVGSIGYSNDLNEVIISSLYVCFKTNEELDDQYLLAYLDTYTFNKDILRYQEGGVRQYLFYENFSHIKIPLPSTKEQQRIVDYLSNIDNKIESVNNQLTQTQTFKKGLLQQMFV